MDDVLKKVLVDEITEFKELGYKFLNGEINRAQFKKGAGKMGVYSHRDGKNFMVRLRTTAGILPIEELKFIYNLAKKHNLDGIHTTTRQTVQLHGVTIDGACDILKEAIEFGICTRGVGGDNPGNIVMSPLSGVKIGEAFDVSPYVFAMDENIEKQVISYCLPRKLKVNLSSDIDDRINVTAADLGFLAVKEGEKNKFKVFIAGGLGRNPRMAIELKETINPEEIVYHLEAMTCLFMAEGDYKNHGKARIRYIVERMGRENFVECYNKHLKEAFEKYGDSLKFEINEKHNVKKGIKTNRKSFRLVEQKQEGLYSLYVKPIGGQFKIFDLEKIINNIESMEGVEVRLTTTEGFYIINLNGEEAEKILNLTDSMTAKTRLEDSVSCVGVPICQMGVMGSQLLLNEIITYFKEKNVTEDILPRLAISGCPNSCAAHEIAPIGFAGKIKRVNGTMEHTFELHVGGKFKTEESKFGNHIGEILQAKIPEYLMEIATELKKDNMEFEEWFCKYEDKFYDITQKYLV